jgi:hypothetical protein
MAGVTEGDRVNGEEEEVAAPLMREMSGERKSQQFPVQGGEGSGAERAVRVWLLFLSLYPKNINKFIFNCF